MISVNGLAIFCSVQRLQLQGQYLWYLGRCSRMDDVSIP